MLLLSYLEMRDIDINYATHFIISTINITSKSTGLSLIFFITYYFYYLYFDTLVESTFSNGTHTYKPSAVAPSKVVTSFPVASAIAA